GTEAALPPEHPPRGRALVPALLRARRGLGPDRAPPPRRAPRRRLGRDRPEGLDELRAVRALGYPAGAHGPRRARGPGDQLLHLRPAGAGRHRAPAPPDDRERGVQRGLPRGRVRPARPSRRPRERGLGDRHHDARPRARHLAAPARHPPYAARRPPAPGARGRRRPPRPPLRPLSGRVALRGHVGDPAQHPRRARAGPAAVTRVRSGQPPSVRWIVLLSALILFVEMLLVRWAGRAQGPGAREQPPRLAARRAGVHAVDGHWLPRPHLPDARGLPRGP